MSICKFYDMEICQSCGWINEPYQAQISKKEEIVKESFKQFGSYKFFPTVFSIESGFRNKAKMVAIPNKNKLLLSFSNGKSSLADCPLYTKAIQNALNVIESWLNELGIQAYDIEKRKGELKFVLLTESKYNQELMLRFVLRGYGVISRFKKNLDQLKEKLPALTVISVNIQPIHMAILEGEEEVFLTSKEVIEEKLNDIPLFIRPKSFFQTNPIITQQLYKSVQQWIDELKPKHIWDLFCGVGGFALHVLGKDRSVVGIEIEQNSIECAKKSLKLMKDYSIVFNSLDAATFALNEQKKPDVIIVNPPRRGLENSLLERVLELEPNVIIYSSCNIQTLVKDLKKLSYLYVINKVQIFDMFPHTEHFETLIELKKVNKVFQNDLNTLNIYENLVPVDDN